MHVKLYSTIGPILILDDVEDGQMRLSALFIAAKEATVPPLERERHELAAVDLP